MSALNEQARTILHDNDRGGFTVPTGSLYPFQWNWDSAFTALGFATFDPDRAWLEIETLLDAQWEDGFVPHIIFHGDDQDYFPGPKVWGTNRQPPTSGITQPPVAASVVRQLYHAEGPAAEARLRRVFPKLVAWHRWFRRVRDPLNKGLVMIVHPWESGRDNSPEWDAPANAVPTEGAGTYERRDVHIVDSAMRPTKQQYDQYLALVAFGREADWQHDEIAVNSPFQVFDVGCTMILLRAERDLHALAVSLGEEDVATEIEVRISLAQAGIGHLWDEAVGAYCSRDLRTGNTSGMVTSASFLAFYAGVGSDQQRERLLEHLQRIDAAAKYLVPSLDPQHAEFDAPRYWRGPVWAVVNYMLARGFAECGLEEWSDRLKSDTRQLIELTGFHEAYCPLTGQPTGGDTFTWTAAMWLAWAGQLDDV